MPLGPGQRRLLCRRLSVPHAASATPGTGPILPQQYAGSITFAICVSYDRVKPVCHEVTILGGQFQTTVTLSNLGYAGIADRIVKPDDLSTGSVASEEISWSGMC